MLNNLTKAPFYGWWVTGSAFWVLFLTYGVQYSFGVFVPAMVEDLGWQRASLGGAFSLYTFIYTGFSLLSGRLTDSLGPRRVIGLGAVLLGIGLIATSQMTSTWQLYLWYGVVAAVGMSTAYIPCNMTVVRWFHRKRGLALGITSCGACTGILVMPALASVLIAKADWRVGLLVFGVSLLVGVSVVARFMVGSPERMGLRPDGDESGSTPGGSLHPGQTKHESSGMSPKEAMARSSFWLLLIGFAVTLLPLTVPFVHLPVFASDIGLASFAGALSVSIIGLFALVGSLTMGPASDRIGRKLAIALSLGLQVAAFLLFLTAEDARVLYVGAAAFGYFYGGFVTLFPAVVGDLFGRAHAGAIGGIVFGCGGVLGAWGPTLAGYLRDVDGDYRLAFSLCAASAMVAALLFAFLPRAPGPPRYR